MAIFYDVTSPDRSSETRLVAHARESLTNTSKHGCLSEEENKEERENVPSKIVNTNKARILIVEVMVMMDLKKGCSRENKTPSRMPCHKQHPEAQCVKVSRENTVPRPFCCQTTQHALQSRQTHKAEDQNVQMDSARNRK